MKFYQKYYIIYRLTSGKKCWGNFDLSLVGTFSIFPENICLSSQIFSSQSWLRKFQILKVHKSVCPK